jgi:molybdopterin/thiamine biosynthesis adenylyltransferase
MDNIERYKGQLDIVDTQKLSIPIHLIGCGGIGSWTALLLAKMGCSDITIYDFDTVEDHNVASQYFEERQLGDLKTEALVSNVSGQTGISLKIGDVENEPNISDGVVIIAVDSMEERWKLNDFFKDKNFLIIDARMGGLQAEIYCSLANGYEPILVAPTDVQHEKCTEKAISFNCALIGSLVANYVRLYVNDKLDLEEFKERTFLFNEVITIRPKRKE